MFILPADCIIDKYPALKADRARCEARPAFQQALRDQMAVFGRA